MNQRPLAPIGGGLNESVAPSEQPQGTYRQGENVRGIDPRTGQMVWGAQRAGMTQLGSSFPEGTYAKHFSTASKLISARVLAELAVDPDEALTPDRLGYTWEALEGDRVIDVAEGIDGQAYYLVSSGDVIVVSKGGEEVERILSAPPRQFMVVPRVYVGEQGEIYTAATRDEAFAGGAGRVYRWTKDLEGIWSIAWESVIQEAISTFVYRAGALYVAEDPPLLDGVQAPAALTRISSPLLGPEIAWRQTVVPRPIFDLSITDRGQCLLSSPANEARGGGNSSFTLIAVDWTPPEIASWDTQGWAWIDALAVNEANTALDDGDEVTLLRDRRFEVDEDLAQPDPESPKRELRSQTYSEFGPPTWDAEAFNGQGGVKFVDRAAMVSGYAEPDDDGATLLGSGSKTIIPTSGGEWTLVMLVQLTEEQLLSAVAGQVLKQLSEATGAPSWRLRFDPNVTDGETNFSFLTGSGGTHTATGVIGGDSTRCVLVSIEAPGDGFALNIYINGLLSGQATPGPPDLDQIGPYPIGNSGVDVTGAFTAIGASNPNRFSLLREPLVTTTASYTGTLSTVPRVERISRLRDGTANTASLNLHSNLRYVSTLTFTFDDTTVYRRADTLAIWSAYGGGTPDTVKVEVRTGSGPFVWTTVAETSLDRAPTETSVDGFGVPTRTEIFFDSGFWQFNAIKLTFSPTANNYVISEIELLDQGSTTADDSAGFVLGEAVSWTKVQTSER